MENGQHIHLTPVLNFVRKYVLGFVYPKFMHNVQKRIWGKLPCTYSVKFLMILQRMITSA